MGVNNQRIGPYPKESTYLQVTAYICTMKENNETSFLDKEQCTSSLRNVLDALYVLYGKWKLALILSLIQSSKRFGEIQRDLDGISPKVLTNELKDLELNGFIKRNVFEATTVSIVYEATEYSRTLKNVIRELDSWGAQHRKRIQDSMRRQV
ncbi:winged helix-turn-helix transcriptional regulator [Sphingobacterium thalpophilum]|uniref:winged helix-turn-helix transcriptional regulator n=1 Tax=Sphingobacterium thalpophilum TaxID=259 RepID=UPI0037DA0074